MLTLNWRHFISLGLAACLLGKISAWGGEDNSWRKACEGSRITLKMNDASGPDIIRKIAELSGNSITIPRESPWSSLRKNYTVDFQDEPFWSVMTKIAAMFPCTIGWGSGVKSELALQWNTEPHVHTKMAFVGPARLELVRYEIVREAGCVFGGIPTRSRPPRADLALSAAFEPRLRILGGKITLTELSDDTGKNCLGSLENPEPAASVGLIRESGIGGGTPVQGVTISTRAPASQAKKFKKVRGTLTLSVQAPGDGARVSVNQAGAELKVGDAVLTLSELSGDKEKGYVAVFTAAEGNSVDRSAVMGGGKFSNSQLIGADGAALDQKGVSFRTGQPARLELKFPWAENFKPQAILFPNLAPTRTLEYPFEWSDVPLPPLTSVSFAATAGADKPLPEVHAQPAPEGILSLSKLTASHFTAKANEMAPADFLAEVERQTGNKIKVDGMSSGPRNQPKPTVTGDFDNVEFWKGMDALCTGRDLKMNYLTGTADSRDWSLSVYRTFGSRPQPAEAVRAPIVQYFGPLRVAITATALKAESSMEYLEKPYVKDEVTLSVAGQTWLEPRSTLLQQGSAFEECLGNDGVDFAAKRVNPSGTPAEARAPKDPRLKHPVNIFDQAAMHLSLNVPLAQGEMPNRIARLRMYYFAQFFDDETFFELTDPAAGEKLLRCGITVRWKTVASGGDGWKTFNVGYVRNGAPVSENENRLIGMGSFQALSAEGKWYPLAQMGGSGNNEYPLQFGFANKIRLRDARGILTYADILELRDIPLPTLPAMP